MKDSTREHFDLLREMLERWSVAVGNRNAFVRGSQDRRDIAEQLRLHLKSSGRLEFLNKLRQSPNSK